MISTKLPVHSAVMTVMTRAAVKASRGLLRDFNELDNLQVSVKNNKSFVTSADLKADGILKEELLHARPTYSLVSEESDEIVGSEPNYKWIIDPLDGTMNYMHGFPHWAVSIALEKDGNIVAAITFDPLRNEMFWAEKGHGAYVNDKKLRVSGKRNLNDLLISVRSVTDEEMQKFCNVSHSIRKTGCTTLNMAYLAAGRFDLLYSSENPAMWDVAAGMLFIKEAGGLLATKDGKLTDNYRDLAIMTNVDLLPLIAKL